MSKNNNVSINLAVLDQIKDHLTAGSYVKVGILGANAVRQEGDGASNVDIGITQEFGSFSKNIPPRSFLRMPIQTKQKQILAFVGSKKVMDCLLSGKVERGLAFIGMYAESWVQSAFASRGFGKWKPNAPATIRRKGSDKPLIDTAELRRSISSEVVLQ
jgi:hypothetical protein